MIDAGGIFLTLAPADKGADVWVIDLDGSMMDQVGRIAGKNNAAIEWSFGRAEFIGTTREDGADRAQRDDARRIYQEIIQ